MEPANLTATSAQMYLTLKSWDMSKVFKRNCRSLSNASRIRE